MSTVTYPEPVLASAPAICDDEPLFEIINGQRVELPPMSAYAARVREELFRILTSSVPSGR